PGGGPAGVGAAADVEPGPRRWRRALPVRGPAPVGAACRRPGVPAGAGGDGHPAAAGGDAARRMALRAAAARAAAAVALPRPVRRAGGRRLLPAGVLHRCRAGQLPLAAAGLAGIVAAGGAAAAGLAAALAPRGL